MVTIMVDYILENLFYKVKQNIHGEPHSDTPLN